MMVTVRHRKAKTEKQKAVCLTVNGLLLVRLPLVAVVKHRL
jgi:hypothetical protein